MNTQNQNYPAPMNNYLGRNRNNTSPNPKSPTNAMKNINMNMTNNNFLNNNIKKQPLLNSKGFGRRASDAVVNFTNNVDKTRYCMNHGNKLADFITQM